MPQPRLNHRLCLVIALLGAMLTGCATAPLSTQSVDTAYTVETARAAPDDAIDRTVVWAGVVAHAENLADRTRIEVVGYPMDQRSQRPRREEAPLGRFLVYTDGYLETAKLSQGRGITVRGTIHKFEEGRIGEAAYHYPALQAEAMEIWSPPARDTGTTRFHFGIGIIFSN